jgi:hypothetical protein
MAIYHASLKAFSRAQGHTATGAAAYRARLCITDTRTGITHDYRRRSGVVSSSIVLPPGSPDWARDPAALWNAAEQAEARCNACVARELEVALPAELDDAGRSALADELAHLLVARFGVAVHLAVHAPTGAGDARNHHVHLLFSTRVVGAEGFGAKTRLLDDRKAGPQEVQRLRGDVAGVINRALSAAQIAARVDHRSLRVQAGDAATRGDIDAVSQLTRAPQVHHGKAATALQRRGKPTDSARRNQQIRRDNAAIRREVAAHQRASRLATGTHARTRSQRVTGGGAGYTVNSPALSASTGRFLDLMRAERERAQLQIRALLEAEAQAEGAAMALIQQARDAAAQAEQDRQAIVRRRLAEAPTPCMAEDDEDDSLRGGAEAARSRDTEPAAGPSRLSRRQWAEKRRRERAGSGEPTEVPPMRRPGTRWRCT